MHSWVLRVQVLYVISPSFTCCSLLVRKFLIQLQVGVGRESWLSCEGMIVLHAELKSRKRIHA